MGMGDHGSALHRKVSTTRSRNRSQSLTSSNYQASLAHFDVEDSADGPIIGYTRGESGTNPSRVNSRTSTHTPKFSTTKNTLEPTLSSKKEYITKEGHPKTEYVWRHPPMFETATGQKQPIYIVAGLGDLSSPRPKTAPEKSYHSEEDDNKGADFGAMRTPANGEEGLLFRDSGYGGGGMLPGLTEKTPLAGIPGELRFISDDIEVIRLGKVVGEDGFGKGKGGEILEGEATRALKRIREKRTSSGAPSVASTVRPNRDSVETVEKGMEGLSMKD
jgi:hypothetical protein